MPIYKNWLAIAAIQEIHLKTFLINEGDEGVLARIRLAYPELFSDSAVAPLVYTKSMLRGVARQKSHEEGNPFDTVESDAELEWFRALGPEVPTVNFSPDTNGVPREIRRQLKGQVLCCGISIRWRDADYLVVGIPGYWPPGHLFKKTPELEWLMLAPPSFIDLEH